MDSSFELASETLSRFASLNIPGRQVQRVVNDLGSHASAWMRNRLRNNGLPRLIIETVKYAAGLDQNRRKQIDAELNYFNKNAGRMTYRTFRSKGYFIGSGAVEGACRHIVAQRTKLSGMLVMFRSR